MTTIVTQDLNDQYVWVTKEETFDEDGVIISSLINYDDGSDETVTYSNGVKFTSLKVDGEEDANTWESIEESYTEIGQVASRLTVYDDTTTKTETFTNGVKTFMVQNDPNDTDSWERIDTYFDAAGKFGRRVQINDDGTTTETEYLDGMRIKVVQQDPSDPLAGDFGAKSWDRIESFFDQIGVIESKIQQNDDRTTITTDYVGGIQSRKIFQDFTDPFGGQDTGAMNWDVVEVNFDEAGIIQRRHQTNDDGSTLQIEYVNGVKTRMLLNDEPATGNPDDLGVKSWDQIDIYYDNGGDVTQKIVSNDNGTVTTTSYLNGIVTHMVQEDRSPHSQARDWVRVDTYYDEGGTIDYRVTDFDDGRLKTEVFENGILDSVVIDDLGNAEEWSTMAFVYGVDGQLAGQGTAYDDGDWVFNEYTSGVQVARHEYDGDDDLPWVGKTTTYNEDGTTDEFFYMTEEELPAEFGNYQIEAAYVAGA